MNKEKIILATSNTHKLKELRVILDGYHIISLKEINFTDEIIEDGSSFEENALIKARYIHKLTNQTVIADDSGLCVDYLKGAPGIYSARYAGQPTDDQANNEKLLKVLEGVPAEKRTAYFVSAAAVVFDNGEEFVCRGEVSGKIGFEPEGGNGFGYDPLFICDETGIRYAEMDAEDKNSISHRKRAFAKLKRIIDDYYTKVSEKNT